MVNLVDSSPIDWYDDKDDGCYDMDLEEELYNTYLENLDLTEAVKINDLAQIKVLLSQLGKTPFFKKGEKVRGLEKFLRALYE